MKVLSLLSIVGLNSATALAAKAGSGCNVEGNLFNLEVFTPAVPTADQIQISQWGDLGNSIARLSDDQNQQTAVFYINKDNNRLIVLDGYNFLNPSNAYTDSPNGGELKFTFYNDTSRPTPYYWPAFDINSAGNLTVNGSSKAFSVCNSKNSTQGAIHIGSTAGKNCTALDGLIIYPLTSQLGSE
ncbi:hypothetical protein BGW36DRAFT_358386 [Talaromyces proteolyticus]|uniref:Uncharacterized protein n=1 Tax=Talaromyces proteolyticus TaxID=1131652 RepID=A0AAD4KU75_9EURO|nr:uncharacterized protein BGW36DRAFT_358386 [Talaromyces proteolyticus]KAH8698875.1 hypothetical protein BGW36DRAFT_358386 [Talaromyces proteolyticus]